MSLFLPLYLGLDYLDDWCIRFIAVIWVNWMNHLLKKMKQVMYDYSENSFILLMKQCHRSISDCWKANNLAGRNCRYFKLNFSKINLERSIHSWARKALSLSLSVCFGRNLFPQLHRNFQYLRSQILGQLFLKISFMNAKLIALSK